MKPDFDVTLSLKSPINSIAELWKKFDREMLTLIQLEVSDSVFRTIQNDIRIMIQDFGLNLSTYSVRRIVMEVFGVLIKRIVPPHKDLHDKTFTAHYKAGIHHYEVQGKIV